MYIIMFFFKIIHAAELCIEVSGNIVLELSTALSRNAAMDTEAVDACVGVSIMYMHPSAL